MADHDTHDHTGVPGVATGDVATSTIWDAAGDLVQGTGSNTGARLAAGSANQFLRAAGAAAAVGWAYPPGYEIDYVAITANVSITATAEGSANTIITGTSFTSDGTAIMIEVQTPELRPPTVDGGKTIVLLYEASTLIGYIGQTRSSSGTTAILAPACMKIRLTPSSGTRQYIVKGIVTSGTGVFGADTGGTGKDVGAYLRITKV